MSTLTLLLFFKLSSGQKTRVILAKTLLNDPEFLLLDEPTSSLDPDIAYKVRQILKDLHSRQKVTMLYTSHNMAEVEEMCSRIIFLQKGQIVASGTPGDLKKDLRNYYLELSHPPAKESLIKKFLAQKKWEYEIKAPGHTSVKSTADDLAVMIKQISQENFDIYDIDINKPDLEEVFLKYARK